MAPTYSSALEDENDSIELSSTLVNSNSRNRNNNNNNHRKVSLVESIDDHDSDEEDEILGLMGRRSSSGNGEKEADELGEESTSPLFRTEIDYDSAVEIVRKVSN